MMEKMYQYIWAHSLWGNRQAKLVDGRSVEVIDPGILNKDSGPDFFNAKVKIDGVVWVGNVEIHTAASNWYRHGHDSDPAYDNVILHVVTEDDARIPSSEGGEIPQLLIAPDEKYEALYSLLDSDAPPIRCRHYIDSIDLLTRISWLDALAYERLAVKAGRITDTAAQNSGDWQQAAFATLCRALGFGLNSEPFEMLGKSVSLNTLHRHSDNIFQLEALLFGQSGFLNTGQLPLDSYYQTLALEYSFLSKKYNLEPLNPAIWKFTRTRPANSPFRRIALLARLCCGGFSMLQSVIEAKNIEELEALFKVTPSEYWHGRYYFGSSPSRLSRTMSESSIRLLIINFAVPLLFAYASFTAAPELELHAVEMLQSLPPEKNSLLSQWSVAGLEADSAFYSQALLQLRKEYCDRRRCLQCRFGHKALRGQPLACGG